MSDLAKIGSVSVSRDRDVCNGVTLYAISVFLADASESSSVSTMKERPSDGRRALWSSITDAATRIMCSTVDVNNQNNPTSSDDDWGGTETRTSKLLEDFDALRNKVYSLAMTSHNFEACEFCEEALVRVLWGGGQDYHKQRNALALLILDESKLLETLAALVRDLVILCSAFAPVTPRGRRVLCRMEDQLPGILHEFLFGSAK